MQCLSYALSRPGASTVVAGVKNLRELRAALAFVDANDAERNYADAAGGTGWNLRGIACTATIVCRVRSGLTSLKPIAFSTPPNMAYRAPFAPSTAVYLRPRPPARSAEPARNVARSRWR